jgi:hypothetical protein
MLVEKKDIVALEPREGFVVKTRVVDCANHDAHPIATKVFINVCHAEQVPAPVEFDPAVVFPLIINNQWEIPIITLCEKRSTDKKGQPLLVYDCCINSRCMRWCQLNADLRSILIEWCLEAVEMTYEVVLEREYTVPKMLAKGELTRTEMLRSELEASVEKKLHHVADGRAAVIELLDEGEAEPLPDIMNVEGRKVVIEEVAGPRATPAVAPAVAPAPAPAEAPSAPELTAVATTRLPKQHPRWGDATVSFTTSCIKVHLPSVARDAKIDVGYDSVLRTLTVSHEDRLLEIAAPTEPTTSFWVGPETTLYVFVR